MAAVVRRRNYTVEKVLDLHGYKDQSNYDSSDSDRKSTRLNSSHANISYAVFCLKKKKKEKKKTKNKKKKHKHYSDQKRCDYDDS